MQDINRDLFLSLISDPVEVSVQKIETEEDRFEFCDVIASSITTHMTDAELSKNLGFFFQEANRLVMNTEEEMPNFTYINGDESFYSALFWFFDMNVFKFLGKEQTNCVEEINEYDFDVSLLWPHLLAAVIKTGTFAILGENYVGKELASTIIDDIKYLRKIQLQKEVEFFNKMKSIRNERKKQFVLVLMQSYHLLSIIEEMCKQVVAGDPPLTNAHDQKMEKIIKHAFMILQIKKTLGAVMEVSPISFGCCAILAYLYGVAETRQQK